jgi:hypothetical protein
MFFPERRKARLSQIAAIAVASLLFSVAANAQVPTSGNVFAGYSYYNSSPLFLETSRGSLSGWAGSLEGKVLPWVGLVADVNRIYGSALAFCAAPAGVAPGSCSSASVHEENVVFGPRVSVSMRKLRPFAEILVGAGHVSANGAGSDTSFATALGGGMDYILIRPIAWRFQGGYVQT